MSVVKTFIRNAYLPICVNCKHYIPNQHIVNGNIIIQKDDYGKCKKYATVNLVSRIIDFDYASICRDNPNKCGSNGLYYLEK